MGLEKIEDYTKDNLVDLYLHIEEELARTKICTNNSGFTKYSIFGSAVIKYRKELKYIRKQLAEDLIEDFGFNHFENDIKVWKEEKEKLKNNTNDADEAQRILDGVIK